MILKYVISFILSVFLPDFFIPKILRNYKQKVGLSDENPEFYFLPKMLGRLERAAYWIFWFFLRSEFVIFVGIWLALKASGDFKSWQQEGHKGRAKFLIFMIGTVLSLISLILIAIITDKFLITEFVKFIPIGHY